MKKTLVFTILSIGTVVMPAQEDMNRFIDNLMGQMTLKEKIGQLNLPVAGEIVTGQAQNSDISTKIRQGMVGGLFNLKGIEKIHEIQRLAVEESRLGIPLLFGMDVIHGYETIFPIPLGLSCTWNMEAIEKSARIAAIEASANGISWTFSPMVDVSRDPRWGRVSEGSGEDPFLGAAIAKAMVRGYQGDLTTDDEIMACVKHFALYGASEAGRDYNTVDMSRGRMYNEYFPPFEAAVKAGVGSVMAAFNEVDGVPATANRWLMTDVLRGQWGFKGFVVTDYTGINEMIEHGIGDSLTVAARAINAGVDMDMVSEAYTGKLIQAVEKGLVSIETIDHACRLILETKYKLGLFANPYKYGDVKKASKVVYSSAHREVARQIAAESFVLLKNDTIRETFSQDAISVGTPLLPLKAEGTIALIGPLADTRTNMPGTWSVAAIHERTTSLREGLQEMLGNRVKLLYAKGSNLMSDAAYEERATMFGRSLGRDNRTDQQLLDEAVSIAQKADVVIAAVGESSEMSGESSSRTDIGIPDVQRNLLAALKATGKPIVMVLFTGRPLTLEWEVEHMDAILNVWFGGTEAAYAIGDVLFGKVNPNGKLTMTFPRNVGQIPIYYASKNTGRPQQADRWFEKFRSNYLDVENSPLYPFGYGLSYTSFEYSEIELSNLKYKDYRDNKASIKSMNINNQRKKSPLLTASITLTNTGPRAGAEIVQLYIQDVVGSITRPVKELKGFKKVWLNSGESKRVSFDITSDLLEFYNYELIRTIEPGEYRLMIGPNSDNVKEVRFTLDE